MNLDIFVHKKDWLSTVNLK